MLSFKEFIIESEGESFKTFKVGEIRYRIDGAFIKFKDEVRRLSGTVVYYQIYKVPMLNGSVNLKKIDEIELLDTDVVELDEFHEFAGGLYYSPFKTGTTANEASFLKSLFIHHFLESDNRPLNKSTVARDIENRLRKERGENREDDEL